LEKKKKGKWDRTKRQLTFKQFAKIIVYALDGMTPRQISEKAGVGRDSVWRYRKLFLYRNL